MDLKREAAKKAATMVASNSVVGLGAGSTIAYLLEFLNASVYKGIELKFVTSSFATLQLLQRYELPVLSIAAQHEIDIYFDGCDQLDKQLNALKSGGGIHTQEKLIASMARQFVLVGDHTKLVDTLNTRYPVVLEVLPQAHTFVASKVKQVLKVANLSMRMSDKKDGPVITENGNYLMDVFVDSWGELDQVNPLLKSISGIVETSLFYGVAHTAVIAFEKEVVVLAKQ